MAWEHALRSQRALFQQNLSLRTGFVSLFFEDENADASIIVEAHSRKTCSFGIIFPVLSFS
jgi:hypothetical protein